MKGPNGVRIQDILLVVGVTLFFYIIGLLGEWARITEQNVLLMGVVIAIAIACVFTAYFAMKE